MKNALIIRRLLSYSFKLSLAMKLTSLLLLVSVFSIQANSYSQKVKVTLRLDNVEITELFEKIEKETKYKFLFNHDELDLNRKVSVNVESEPLSNVLQNLFAKSSTSFVVRNRQIILKSSDLIVPILEDDTNTSWKDEVVVQSSITGTVTDENGQPLPGANVVEKGTTNGVTTDFDGNYSIQVSSSSAILTFSYVGFEKKDVSIGTSTILDVSLSESAEGLDEVVVVGYGTQAKENVTGAVASLSEERLESLPNNNVLQALQGSVAGLSVTQSSASAEGSGFNVLIRGTNSILANNQPLIVLDGVPYSGSFSDINPTDIASVQVLKDASSSAIYGSRGANGVILITTKKGKDGKVNITYDGFVGINQITNVPELLDGPEFYAFREERSPGFISPTEQEAFENNVSTDWVDVVSRTAFKSQHTLSVSGGTENTNYYVSLSSLDAEGVTLGDDFNRVSLRVNLNANINEFIKIGTNTQLNRSDRSGLGPSFDGDLASQADPYRMNPLIQPFDNEGNQLLFPWPDQPRFGNPLQNLLAEDEDVTNKIFTNNFIEIGIPFIPGLSYKLNTGVEYENRKADTYFGTNTVTGILAPNGRLNSLNIVRENYLLENIINYDRQFGKHNVGFTGLLSYQEEKFDQRGLFAANFPSDILTFYQADQAQQIVPSVDYRKSVLLSQMARLNYAFDSKYLLTLTGRRDGFSGFGPNNKFSFFPSVALGWKISDENFMNGLEGTVNFLKLRVTYGQNGNQAIQPYQSKSRLESLNYVENDGLAPGFVPSQLQNSDLSWETTTSLNLGLDFQLFSSRIQGSIDYYRNNTEDLLLNRSIPSTNGVSFITQNVGETQNNGLEIALNTFNFTGPDFQWSTDANISINKNEIISLVTTQDDINNEWFIGQPINVNYGYIFDGVFQDENQINNSAQPESQVGDAIIRDLNGRDELGNLTGVPDGVINEADRTIIGSLQPDYSWGMTNRFSYKGFGLNIFLQGVQGINRPNDIYDDDVRANNTDRNYFKFNYWTPENPTNFRWANREDANTLQRAKIYEDASFWRLKDVTFSYDLKKAFPDLNSFSSLLFYVTGRNLATVTSWNGLDPEIIGSRSIPLQKEFVLGMKLGF